MATATKSRVPKKAKPYIELQPDIETLAAELGMKLFWRDDALWADDVQLLYQYEITNGKQIPLGQIKQASLAKKLLQGIKDARAKWPSPARRAKNIIAQFRRDIVKPHAVKAMHFCGSRDASLDSVWVFGGRYMGDRQWDVRLALVGRDEIRAEGKTLAEATDNLEKMALAIL